MLTITKELLVRYFEGRCNPEETEAVRAFIASETDPVLVGACMREVFEETEQVPLTERDYAHAWQQFRQKSGWQPAPPPVKRVSPQRWLRYAAAAVLIVAVGIAGWQFSGRKGSEQPAAGSFADAPMQRIQALKGARKQVTLTDGSMVHLFPGSELSIPDDFNEKDRSVLLKGRAFFEITKNPQKPFLVQTGQLTTRVLGTSFEINEVLASQTSVTVRTGMVGIHYNQNELTRLTPNQQLIYEAAGSTYTVHPADADGLCNWINGELVFDNTTLPEVCRTLEQWYGANIQLDKEHWKAKKISVKFKDQPLSTVMQVLSLTSGFRYKLNDKEVNIY